MKKLSHNFISAPYWCKKLTPSPSKTIICHITATISERVYLFSSAYAFINTSLNVKNYLCHSPSCHCLCSYTHITYVHSFPHGFVKILELLIYNINITCLSLLCNVLCFMVMLPSSYCQSSPYTFNLHHNALGYPQTHCLHIVPLSAIIILSLHCQRCHFEGHGLM
jgi:hypothetical protein